MQSSQANCGATALYNAAQALGKQLDLMACERVCRTTATDGTSIRGFLFGAKKLGLQTAQTLRCDSAKRAESWLNEQIVAGSTVAVTVDESSHWAAVIGKLGDRWLLADSADNELVLSLSTGELMHRWCASECKPKFYGVALS